MVKPILDFLQIHGEVILGDTPIVVKDVLSITPKALDAIDVVFGSFIDQGFVMTYGMVFTESFERLIPAKGIGVIDRTLSGAGFDMTHKLLGGNGLDHLGIDATLAFQQAKDDTFTGRPTPAPALTLAAEIRLIEFDLAFELATFEFAQVKQCFAQTLVDPGDRLDVHTQVNGQSVCRLQLIESAQNRDLPTQPGQALGLATRAAFDVAACSTQHLEGTTENALPTPQKVGRTTEMTAFRNNHRYLPYTFGYETP